VTFTRALTAAALMAVPAFALARPAAAEEPISGPARVKSIEVRGKISDQGRAELLQRIITTRENAPYSDRQLDADIKSINNTGRFRSAVARVTRAGAAADGVSLVDVIIEVDEAEIIREVRFAGAKRLDPAEDLLKGRPKWLDPQDYRMVPGQGRRFPVPRMAGIPGPDGSGKTDADEPEVETGPVAASWTRDAGTIIRSYAGRPYSRSDAVLDAAEIAEWYRSKYFLLAAVTSEAAPAGEGAVTLTFHVWEGPKCIVRRVQIDTDASPVESAEKSDSGAKIAGRSPAGAADPDLAEGKLVNLMSNVRPGLYFWSSSDRFDRLLLEKDLETIRLYCEDKGYRDARAFLERVEIEVTNPGEDEIDADVSVFLRVAPGRRYAWSGRIEVRGAVVIPPDKLRELWTSGIPGIEGPRAVAKVAVKKGDSASPASLEALEQRIKYLYGRKGYPFTAVAARPVLREGSPYVDMRVDVNEGERAVVREVNVKGLRWTRPEVVLREMEIGPGDPYDAEKVNRSLANLRRLEYFDPTRLAIVPRQREEGVADLEVAAEDLKGLTGRLRFGLFFSSDKNFGGDITYLQRNSDITSPPESFTQFITGESFRGAGETLQIELMASLQTARAQFHFEDPWFMDRPIFFTADAMAVTSDLRFWNEFRAGGGAGVGWRFERLFTVSGRYQMQYVNVSNLNPALAATEPDEAGGERIGKLIVSARFDNRDNPMFPTRGLLASLDAEVSHESLGSTRDFWSLKGRSIAYFDLAELPGVGDSGFLRGPAVLLVRGQWGMVQPFGRDDTVPLFERFTAGGINSLRGYERQDIGPKAFGGGAVANAGGGFMVLEGVEYLQPIFTEPGRIDFYLSAFFDAGQVWDRIDDVRFIDQKRSYGLGVLLRPLGSVPIGFYFCKAIGPSPLDSTEKIAFSIAGFF
jgi:outer membrane protein insertion porin family